MELGSNHGSILILLLFFLLATTNSVTEAKNFDVTQHGAKSGGTVDNTQAFVSTWKEACAAAGPERSTYMIPKGTFLVGPVTFEGPCKGPVDFLIQGTLKAEADPAKFPSDNWIVFQHLTDFKITGGGSVDGQGQLAWKANDCSKNTKCRHLPINIRFSFLTNVHVSQITSMNSKNFNVNILSCKNITLEHFTVTNPKNSLNTDGIHMGRSSQVSVLNLTIATGDDCVSIGEGSVDVKVIGVTCGPGHGVSIGSLGKYPNEGDVNGITVKNCTFIGTDNGVRIKTWAKAPNSAAHAKSKASNFIFEDLVMDNVQNPIVIDQVYCPYVKCSQADPSMVAISDVSFNKIRGTSTTKNVVSIVCSKAVPCQGVKIGDINLHYTGKDGPAGTICSFAKTTFTGKQIPAITATS